MMGLKEFLVSVKAQLAEFGPNPRIHIVIGNESCDLDSTISSVSYAYFLHTTKPSPDTLYVPVMNIPREQFRLRLETLYLLNKHSIVTDNLIFTDDLDLLALTQNEATALTVTLVDHHELTRTEECLSNFIVEVLDHRPQSGVLPESWKPHIERVGSCCTIIARKLLASEDFTVDPTLAELLLGTILMDTGNMSVSDGVGTLADHDVLVKLQSYLPPDSADSIYEGIRNAKSDLSSLRVLEILYKDLKVLKGTHITVAMASITMELEEVLSRSEFLHDCAEFCSALPADVLIMMTLWRETSGLPHRGVAVFSLNRIYREQITDVLLSSVSPNLELQQMTSFSYMDHISAFTQNNVQVFRKGVLPLIREFLAGESTTPDENLNAADSMLQDYSDLHLGSASPGDKGYISEEETRRHINLAKTYQSDQFRTSQDRYDLAAVGMEPVISPSLSSDSEFSNPDKRNEEDLQGEEEDYVPDEDKADSNDGYDLSGAYVDVTAHGTTHGYDLSGAYVDVTAHGTTHGNVNDTGDEESSNLSLETKDTFAAGDGAFVNSLIEVGFESHGFESQGFESHGFEDQGFEGQGFESVGLESHDESYLASIENAPQSNTTNDLLDFLGDDYDGVGSNDLLSMRNNMDILRESEHPVASSIDFLSDLDLQAPDTNNEEITDPFRAGGDNVAVELLAVDNNKNDFGGDELQDYNSFSILCPDNVDSPLDFSSMPTSNQTSGQGSKIPSYPETPPNSCIEPSSIVMNKETQLPSFNSSEMVRRIQEKKAALAGHHGSHKKSEGSDDAENVEGLFVAGESSSGGGGSLVSPAVPQNSYVDLVGGFDFQSSSHQLPKLMNSDFMERVNEKRSQFEWSIESLEGSTSGVDVGPNSEEGVRQSPFIAVGAQHIAVNAGADHQVPYTPQNSYVEEHLDTYARSSLPSLNSAEIVAKIKAKQSAMFGSGSSSRVSRSSHGSDDSGGCRSPDVVDKSPREASLDSPQAPYTPQNSFRDNIGSLESQNHLPDLNEVAERLSTGNALKHQFGKRSTSNSGGGSRDEENINLNINQQSHRRYGRNSSSQSDSQNTMSDVESLMSVSTDIATPSDNIVATVLASQMRNEIAMLSRKDTNDSDVFPAFKTEESTGSSRDTDLSLPKVSHFDLVVSEKMMGSNFAGTNPDRTSGDNPDGVVSNGYAGAKELFSPLDSNKVHSIEDHAIFEAAESIVARSVAAAVESSKKNVDAGGFRKESRLRWNDDLEPVVNDDDMDLRFNSQNEDDDDTDTTGDISESLPDNGLDTVVSQNESLVSPNIAEQLTIDSVIDPFLDSSPQDTQLTQRELSDDSQITSQNHVPQSELALFLEPDPETPGLSPQIDTATFSLAEQNLADLALNELAFEVANELIQRVLDDFPFNQDLTNTAHDGTTEVEQGKTSLDEFHVEESAASMTQQLGCDNTSVLDTENVNLITLYESGNNENNVSSEVIQTIEDDSDFDSINSDVPRCIEDNLNNITSSIAEEDFQSSITFLESAKHADSSPESNSLSPSAEGKKSRDTDLSMTIMENEIMTTFPERKTSADFTALEEEDIIQSFPGRKFSRSEDYPSRRFSREETSSRRSSRLEDQDLEVTIGPEDIETDYLPNMDPLQGNLDIIDSSFSKITDANREVVEGESFRKISGENFLSSSGKEYDEESEGSGVIVDDHLSESDDGLYTGMVDKLEPEEYSDYTDGDLSEARGDQLVTEAADISGYLETQSADNSHAMITESSTMLEGQAVDSASEIEFQGVQDSDEIDMQTADIFSQPKVQTEVSSDEINQQDIDSFAAVVIENPRVSDEEVMNARDMFNMTEIYAADKHDTTELQPTEHARVSDEEVLNARNIISMTEIYAADKHDTTEIQPTGDARVSDEEVLNARDIISMTEIYAADKHDTTEIQPTGDARVSHDKVLNARDMFNMTEIYAADKHDTPELQPSEDIRELEIEASDFSDEPEIWAIEKSNELEILAAEKSTEHDSDFLDDRIQENDESLIEEVNVPKQKKKIRVSFSEDFDEEIGDFNITSSCRSPLKSPPPLQSAEDSGSSASSVENINSTAGDEDDVPPLLAAPTQWTPYQQSHKKEIYHTSAGRISISLGEESDGSGLATDGVGSPHLVSFTDQIIGKARAQVEEIIESAKWAISEADDQLVVKDVSTNSASHSPSSNAPIFDSPEVSQPTHDVGVMSQHETNNPFESFIALNFDLSAVNSNPMNETSVESVADNPEQDNQNEPTTAEPSAVTSHHLTSSQQQPVSTPLSQFDSLTSDPFTSLPTHVRNLSSASTGSVQGAVYSEEWQDDEIVEVAAQSGLDASSDDPLRKKLVPEPSLPETEEVVTDNDVDMEDNKKEDDQDSDAGDLEWENDTPVKTPARPGIEPTLTEDSIPQGVQRWKRVSVSGSNFDIDMQAVEPYRNVLSHGGYYDEGLSAIIVFYGCNLPSNRNEDYAYIMNHLFHYVIHTLEELVADDYVIIYFHGSTPRRQMPSLGWLKRCYQSIDRRLRKNLKGLFLVHPTLWLRTVVMMTRPFISTKFTSKLRFVRTLEELNALVPLNNVSIPEPIVHFDIHHKHLPTPPESPYHFPSS